MEPKPLEAGRDFEINRLFETLTCTRVAAIGFRSIFGLIYVPLKAGEQLMNRQNGKADRVDTLLRACIPAALITGVFQWAEHHFLRAILAAMVFLVILPWLGRRFIRSRSQGV